MLMLEWQLASLFFCALVFSEYIGTTEVAGLICSDIEMQELNWLFVTVLFRSGDTIAIRIRLTLNWTRQQVGRYPSGPVWSWVATFCCTPEWCTNGWQSGWCTEGKLYGWGLHGVQEVLFVDSSRSFARCFDRQSWTFCLKKKWKHHFPFWWLSCCFQNMVRFKNILGSHPQKETCSEAKTPNFLRSRRKDLVSPGRRLATAAITPTKPPQICVVARRLGWREGNAFFCRGEKTGYT